MDPAIARLLDDPSPAVRRALKLYLGSLGDEAEGFLRSLAGGEGALADAASQYLKELDFSDPAADFRAFIRSFNYELETGCLLLARTVSPAADAAACHRRLDAMADRCRELIVEPSTIREKCRVLNRVLFHEWGFRADAADPTGGEGADSLAIDRVLERRKGAPIAIVSLYALVADRLGIALDPVILERRCFARGECEGGSFFADPLEQGTLLTRDQALKELRRLEPSAHPGDLGPTPLREVLGRCCRALQAFFVAAGDEGRARLFAGFIEEFSAAYARHER